MRTVSTRTSRPPASVVWFAPEDLNIADRFRTRIDESIPLYDKLLLILSGDLLTSPWVEDQVEAAYEKDNGPPQKTVLFAVRLDNTVLDTNAASAATLRRTRHISEFRHWKTTTPIRRRSSVFSAI